MHHPDPETNQAITKLLDCLCQWERNTGRGSTLILIPHNSEEETVLAQDGKPMQGTLSEPEELLNFALQMRDQ